jgi:hypothetical protein
MHSGSSAQAMPPSGLCSPVPDTLPLAVELPPGLELAPVPMTPLDPPAVQSPHRHEGSVLRQ